MKPHPDFVHLAMPQTMTLGPFRLSVLTLADLEEDYAAVMGSKDVLQGLFDPIWPEGLTLDEDAMDLQWHHREFLAKRSFAWGIRDDTEAYLGCAYLFPEIGRTGSAEAVYWFVHHPDKDALTQGFGAEYMGWLRNTLPEGYAITERC